MKRKRMPPSRIKYEQNHPTVSFRVTKELYDRLEEVKKAEGESTADVLKVGVGLLNVKVSEEKEARTQGREEGFNEGYEMAEDLYKVTYQCRGCGKIIEVTTKEEKRAIKEYMQQNGWGHKECVDSSC